MRVQKEKVNEMHNKRHNWDEQVTLNWSRKSEK